MFNYQLMLINTLRSLSTLPLPKRASHHYRALARFKKKKTKPSSGELSGVQSPKEMEKTGALAAE